jgi:Tfp pilus assembly protein PilO
MNVLRLKTWSERQQVLAIILMAGSAIFAIYFFLLMPQNRKRRLLKREISDMRSQLRQQNYLTGESALRRERDEEDGHNRGLRAQWTNLAVRLAAFSNQAELADSHVGHIDFKVALFDVRRRLQYKSRQLGISLPHDLGMDDEVRSNEDARQLMLQLRAVEKLVDVALDLKISMLRSIEPMPQILHRVGGSAEKNEPGKAYLEEYPVQVEFFGSFENLYELLHAILEPEHVFVLRRLRVESTSYASPGLLTIKAMLSALVFTKGPEDTLPRRVAVARRRTPTGH